MLIGFGLRLRHLAQRYRLPFTAVFGRFFLPELGSRLGIADTILSPVYHSPDFFISIVIFAEVN